MEPKEENVTIDLDGGGPLRKFEVRCLYAPVPSSFWAVTATSTTTFRPLHISSHSGSEEEHGSSKFIVESSPADEERDLDVTILPNDAPPEGVFVDGPTEPGAIRRVIDYGIGGVELDRFIDGFEACRQYMRFECRGGTRLMTYGQERRPSTWYATRNGQHGLQWADAPPYSRQCQCALNASCDHNRQCNCDSGRDGADDGWNSHHQLLPVMQLYVGGTGRGSSANISIGALRCTRRCE